MDDSSEKNQTEHIFAEISSRPKSRASATTFDTVNGNISRRLTHEHGSNRAPGVKWHHEYDEDEEMLPRVLMIEYHRRNPAQIRKVTAREFKTLNELRTVYQEERSNDIILRVFHVQNCSWGERYLLRKLAFDAHTPAVHTATGNSSTGPHDFARWVKERPPRRLGKLMMNSRTWKTHTDPWRGVAKTAFGMDYMKAYACDENKEPRRPATQSEEEQVGGERDRVVGLQGFDENDNTTHAYNVYSQRLSVYVQYKHRVPPIPDPDLVCPYGDNPSHDVKRYDNGNSILIVDNSHSHCIFDTLIPARGHLEAKWRRIPFSMSTPIPAEADTEGFINLHCMKMILRDVFKAVVNTWEKVLEVSWEHVSILEDAIYEQPADESRAPDLWRNSAHWNRYEKLMFLHVDTMNDMRRYLGEFVDVVGEMVVAGGDGSGSGIGIANGNTTPSVGGTGLWLEELPPDFDKLGNLIQEDLVKPTASLSELMYRSVAIRDSRASLQLGSSMWRLSWITFIFLPLTFIVGFFGMNVQTFAGGDTPDIKWFFIVIFPFFTFVLLGWYLLKHLLARSRRTPSNRGVYEAFYTRLEETNSALWTRQGPKEYVTPADWSSRWKWRVMKYWASQHTRAPKAGEANESIGAWETLKRGLMKKWSREIRVERELAPGIRMLPELELGEMMTMENRNEERLIPRGRAIAVQSIEVPVGNDGPNGAGEGAAMVEVEVESEVQDGQGQRQGGDEDSEIMMEERREGPGMDEVGEVGGEVGGEQGAGVGVGVIQYEGAGEGEDCGHRLGVKGLLHRERSERSEEE